MGNNTYGDRNSVNNFNTLNNNSNNGGSGFNISNLFDLSRLGNLFGIQSKGANPLLNIGRMFGMNSRQTKIRTQIKVLPIEEAYRVIKSGNCFLLDIRTEMEYSTIRIKGSVNIPLDKLQTEITQIVTDRSEMIIVYCATGSRVRRAVQILWSLGYNNVCIWEGAGINTFAFADLIVYNDRQLDKNNSNTGGI